MNSYSSRSDEYKLLKKNWKILAKKPFNLTPYQMHIQDLAANMHPDLYQATILKDWFYQINACSNYDETLSFINDFLSLINESELKEFQDVIKTFINWKTEIINAYIIKVNGKNLTNAVIEGINNYIKVVKRTSYGFRNFNRFRMKIIHTFNKNPMYQN